MSIVVIAFHRRKSLAQKGSLKVSISQQVMSFCSPQGIVCLAGYGNLCPMIGQSHFLILGGLLHSSLLLTLHSNDTSYGGCCSNSSCSRPIPPNRVRLPLCTLGSRRIALHAAHRSIRPPLSRQVRRPISQTTGSNAICSRLDTNSDTTKALEQFLVSSVGFRSRGAV